MNPFRQKSVMNKIPKRNEVPVAHTWDLGKLFPNEKECEKTLEQFEQCIGKISSFKGTLGQSAQKLAKALDYIITESGILNEQLGCYTFLRYSEDVAETRIQALHSRYIDLSTRYTAATSWLRPEIQAIPDEKIRKFMKEDCLADYQIFLSRLLRLRPYTLSGKEESIMARQKETAMASSNVFSALTNSDMSFGTVAVEGIEMPLTNSSLISFLKEQKRDIREEAYKKYYSIFNSHRNTLASLYNASVIQDKFEARVFGYASARHKALFQDDVPIEVYDNLVNTVRESLPVLHEYYKTRSACLKLQDSLRPWDLHISLVTMQRKKYTWQEAVDMVCDSLQSLGDEYVNILRQGLDKRWVDIDENKGKLSGAFSSGSYKSEPYILMNFQNNINDVFTLAHEAGHSMHSWYSKRHNPFAHYEYSIFEAEVASTFNEILLFANLLGKSSDKQMKAYMIANKIDDVINTVFRQTMFAEFEKKTHEIVEKGQGLTIDIMREIYGQLQTDYFGPAMKLHKHSNLECLRIPHFYRAFYVYKYATGLSAAITLSGKVLEGSQKERQQYLDFLKLGGSHFPIESLKIAGVDMRTPQPVERTLREFKNWIEDFKNLI